MRPNFICRSIVLHVRPLRLGWIALLRPTCCSTTSSPTAAAPNRSVRPRRPCGLVARADVTVAAGALSTKMGPASQKIWTYFTDAEPVTLAVGQKLTASISFIPRKVLPESTSRSFRIGLFHDATSPRVEDDVNNDGGGAGAPWTDATGLRGPSARHRRRILQHQAVRPRQAHQSRQRQPARHQRRLHQNVRRHTRSPLALDKEYRRRRSKSPRYPTSKST